jgi:orotate phosphoribosyltransferase
MNQVLDALIVAAKYLVPILVALYIIFVASRKAWQGIKEFWLFLKVLRVDQQGVVANFFSRIADLPPESVANILSQVLLPVDNNLYIEGLVRNYTQVLPEQVLIGIHDTKKGKVKTRYYVDILSACCDSKTRRKLSQMIAIRVTDVMRKNSHTFDAIAVPARGNMPLAVEVADLLDKPIVVFGDLAGVKFPDRLQAMQNIPKRYIIVDGLSASGEEILHVANMIKSLGGQVSFVFTIIDRCFGAKDRVRHESPFDFPIELIYLEEYDDRKCKRLLNPEADF